MLTPTIKTDKRKYEGIKQKGVATQLAVFFNVLIFMWYEPLAGMNVNFTN